MVSKTSKFGKDDKQVTVVNIKILFQLFVCMGKEAPQKPST